MDFNELEDKYIDLVLRRCLNFEQARSLMIHLDLKKNFPFACKVKEKAQKMGILDVWIDLCDQYDLYNYLAKTELKDIKLNYLIDRSKWDLYAKKGGALLFILSEIPGLMKDIDPQKLNKIAILREGTSKYYRENVTKYTFPWSIITLPNVAWAKAVFPDDQEDVAYEKLYLKIMEMCMVTTNDPIKAWEEFIKTSNEYKEKLNALQITELHYQNSLGTDLYVSKRPDASWINLDKTDQSGNPMIANMPSYEIFTSPDFHYTRGIVYSSRPLIYQGVIIDDFYLRFVDGKVVDFDAKVGRDALKNILTNNKNACYLGEIALVENNSPISKTNLVYNTTLFDENASCHLALGDSYKLPIENASMMNAFELQEVGLNTSPVHIDFMIGTSDLNIEAQTAFGRKLIFKQGNFNL